MSRSASLERVTRETKIVGELMIEGRGRSDIATGIGFLDHLLTSLTRHSQIDLRLHAEGDLEVDDHHTAEDCGIVLGQLLDRALGERAGIARFGSAYAPLDEALARAVIDISGRPFAAVELGLRRDVIGSLACENIGHVLHSIAMQAKLTMHVDLIRGENDHHRAEAAFKAAALALRQAMRVDPDRAGDVPSTKGVIG